jgi:hypothetical protein
MILNNIINKIGRERLIHWVFLFSLSLFCVGLFEFFYLWVFKYQIDGYLKFAGNYNFNNFIVQFIQVYSVLFIPLLSFIGFKYRNSIKFNGKKLKVFSILFLIGLFSGLIYSYHSYGVWEWVFLFMPIFIIISLKYSVLFAFSFSYLGFYSANMLFEFQGLNFLKSSGTLLSYILVFGIFIFTLYKLKIKLIPIEQLIVYLSFIPIVVMWIIFFPIWQLPITEFYKVYIPYDLYVRLFTFPFYITISLVIYFTKGKYDKSYILNQGLT